MMGYQIFQCLCSMCVGHGTHLISVVLSAQGFFFLAAPTDLALANQATPHWSGVLLRPRCLHLSPLFQDVHLVPLLGNGSWVGVPLRRLTTVDPDVRIGQSLPSGILLVTCQIGAGETASIFWCRCSLRYTFWGGFGGRVVYYQMYIPRALWHLGSSKPGWIVYY